MIAHEVNALNCVPARKDAVNAQLATIQSKQKGLMQQIQDRQAEDRPRLAILDDQLDELERARETLVIELAKSGEPAEDFEAKIARLKTQFNPEHLAIAIRKLLFLARNNADEYAKKRLMPIVRDLIQTVVIGKTPGHEPASLQVHGSIANIMASMEVLDIMEQQFLAAAQNDLMARMASGEIDTEAKRKKLLDGYAEELILRFPEWSHLQVSVVAGA